MYVFLINSGEKGVPHFESPRRSQKLPSLHVACGAGRQFLKNRGTRDESYSRIVDSTEWPFASSHQNLWPTLAEFELRQCPRCSIHLKCYPRSLELLLQEGGGASCHRTIDVNATQVCPPDQTRSKERVPEEGWHGSGAAT